MTRASTTTSSEEGQSLDPNANSGDDPMPEQGSTEAASPPLEGVPHELARALREHGIETLTPVQLAVVSHLNGEAKSGNLRISSQTGSGKTVALGIALSATLQLPREASSAGSEPTVLVITPTRELAHQVRSELEWLFAYLPGVRVDSVTGGTDVRREQSRLKSKPPRILVGTPGRLLDHLRGGALSPDGLREVVLDEADQMLDLGFKDELDAIVERLPKERRSHLVSATFPPAVGRLARAFQGECSHIEGTALGQANADIEHVAHLVRPRDRYAGLVNLLLSECGQRCLIFVRTRAETAELSEALAKDGFAALPLSGELPQAQRSRTLAAFRNGSIDILVATDVAARGIDVPDIGTVIHTDIPAEPDVYTHRSGRTGRAGKSGKSLFLVLANAQARVERLLRLARVEASWQPIPSAKKIRQSVVKSTRRALYENLEQMQPSEPELAYAQNLLGKLPGDRMVAALLRMAETRLPRAPADIESPEPQRGARRPQRGEPAAASAASQGPTTFVRFRLSWGSQHGATTARCMSHVCRRGAIDRERVGAIRVGESATVVEIARDIAADFEQRCKKPDSRDPLVRISRERDSSAANNRGRDTRKVAGRRPPPHRSPAAAGPRGKPHGGPRLRHTARGRPSATRPPEA